MKILVIIIALLAVPLIVGLCQNKKYETSLKHELKNEASSIMSKHSVENSVIMMDKVDATIDGVVPSEDIRTTIGNEVDDIDGLRLQKANNQLKVIGTITAEKSGDAIQVSGNIANEDTSINFLSSMDNLSISKSNELNADPVFIDPPIAASSEFQSWAQRYFSVKEARGFTLQGNGLTLTGSVTPRLRNEFTSSAKALNLNVTSNFEIIEPTEANLDISKTDNVISLSGNLPEDYSLENLGLSSADTTKVSYHPFTEDNPSLSDPEFSKFVASYLKPQGERSLSLKETNITLAGAATRPMISPWLSTLKMLNLEAKNDLKIYPSAFHFPSYKSEAKLTVAELQELKDDLAVTAIYFDSGSSEVNEGQIVKIELAASAINNARNNAQYVIGGHADATGDIEKNQTLSKLRAQAVLRKLEEKGVDIALFEVISFGAAKAATDGPSASDRRVEILIR